MSLAQAHTAEQLHITLLQEALKRHQSAFRADPAPDLHTRKDRVQRLLSALLSKQDQILQAISADFGHRSSHESAMADVALPALSIRHTLKHMAAWSRPEKRPVPLHFLPASARVVPQPLGVVGIISPWNYPIQLAIVPLASALAAGNRVMLKPSELTPRTSELMASLLADLFPPDLVSVHTGGPQVGAAFSALAFDHLFYTGSTSVGRHVMRAAAENLTPVTLELGGKSPVIVHPGFDLDRAADRIAKGKTFNAGQTCVAPDYVLVHHRERDELVYKIAAQIRRMYPTLLNNPDYTAVVNERHHARLQGLLTDAKDRGATLTMVNPGQESFEGSGTKMAPHLLVDVTDDMRIMQDEIFGPLLPIVGVDSVDEAMARVNRGPRPLALYYFDTDSRRVDRLLRQTHSGGVTINDTMMHVAQEDLPFGGIGGSGMGAYHGVEGFNTFTHRKAVYSQPRLNGGFLLDPPYGRTVERLVRFLMGKA